MNNRFRLEWLAILVLLIFTFSSTASAQLLYSNMPWSDSGGPCIGSNGANATGVAVMAPAGGSYQIASVLLSMHDVGGGF